MGRAGIWLILSPEMRPPCFDNLWGIASGVTAALAILYLNMSRRYHDSETVLFYMLGIGGITMYLLFRHEFFWPARTALYYLVLCSVFGTAGQYLLTLGCHYVTAVEGGVISSSRILMAALLGPRVAGDPALPPGSWIGALMIFSANVTLAARRREKQKNDSKNHPAVMSEH